MFDCILSLRDLPCFKRYKLFPLLIANKYPIDFFKAKKKDESFTVHINTSLHILVFKYFHGNEKLSTPTSHKQKLFYSYQNVKCVTIA